MKPHISVVVPVYKSEGTLIALVERLQTSLTPITPAFEIILIEDGSTGKDWEVIWQICQKNSQVKAIKLSRNFGQHQAITAGLDLAQGEWIVVMDCDLQDMPEEIPALYQKAQEGYDVVLASRQVRQDNFFKKFYSKAFYYVLFVLTGVRYNFTTANFGIYHAKVIEAIRQMRESSRFLPTMVQWVGFRQTAIPVKHAESQNSKSSYNFLKRMNLALDILLSYSDKPIRLIIAFGLMVALLSLGVITVYLVKYFLGQIKVLGYASLILSIWFLSGVIIVTLGVVGLYVGKTFENVRKRPIYIIEQKLNFND
ncbi:MAG: glycosyltransferase family 2 protein [Raineya sp.]|nr:glycosyltransferase family 2 protein [Raineya sp.]MDW8296914.1 glycosyltransferase family 2 protein [Raineya sp.]